MFCKIWDKNKVWYTNLESQCTDCLNNVKQEIEHINCPLYKNKCNVGVSLAHKENIFLCCSIKECKNNKRFSERFSLLKSEIPFLISFMNDIKNKYAQEERNKYSQIVHNLKTLNAQSISSQSLIIPQDLHDTYHNLFSVIEEKVRLEPKAATKILLKLAKNNQHMKTEFITHEKLSFENPILFKQYHNIITVILNVYHSFDMDFNDKKITLDIDENDDNKKITLYFDYDTIRVALYHMFSNATKYMKPNSSLEIKFKQTEKFVDVIFLMDSLHILPSEITKIFDDHYSGIQATSLKLNGNGLGMGFIKKALEINEGYFKVIAEDKFYRSRGINYSRNTFILRFNNINN